MSRPLSIEFPGGLYHVTSRGDRREPISIDDQDRAAFLTTLIQAIDRFDVCVCSGLLPDGQPLPPGAADATPQPLARDARHINGVYCLTPISPSSSKS